MQQEQEQEEHHRPTAAFITEEDTRRVSNHSTRRATGVNMFETRGIPFILLDIVCLVLGMCYNNIGFCPFKNVCRD